MAALPSALKFLKRVELLEEASSRRGVGWEAQELGFERSNSQYFLGGQNRESVGILDRGSL